MPKWQIKKAAGIFYFLKKKKIPVHPTFVKEHHGNVQYWETVSKSLERERELFRINTKHCSEFQHGIILPLVKHGGGSIMI